MSELCDTVGKLQREGVQLEKRITDSHVEKHDPVSLDDIVAEQAELREAINDTVTKQKEQDARLTEHDELLEEQGRTILKLVRHAKRLEAFLDI